MKQKDKKENNGGFNMMKTLRKQLKNEKGLTLIELLAVIVILGIIAAIAIPAIGNIITNSKYNAVKADALNVLNAAQMYYLDNPEGEKVEDEKVEDGVDKKDPTNLVTIAILKEAGYLETTGEIPVEGTAYVTNSTPLKLTTPEIVFATGKSVTFKAATIEDINKDPEKGSSKASFEIGSGTE